MECSSGDRPRPRVRWLRSLAAAAIVLTASIVVRLAVADVVTLQSGIVVEGKAVPIHGLTQRTARRSSNKEVLTTLPEPWWVVDDGVRYYFAPARQTQVEKRQDLARVPEFTLPPSPRRGNSAIDVIGSSTATPWDEFGRRTVTLKTARGDVPVLQEIIRVRPDYVGIRGVTHEWSMGLDTRLIPDDVLRALIKRGSRTDNIDDQKAAVSFYLDARRFDLASQALDELIEAHPEVRSWAEPQRPLIAEQKYRAAINEVQRRRRTGQHRLAFLTATAALTAEVPADALLQCREILAEYDTARQTAGQVQLMLEQLEAQLPNDEAAPLRPLRPQLLDELHFESLPRLEPFLRAKGDKDLTPAQKLALAYSGWVVGPSYADIDLSVATNLWHARFLVLEYLRADDNPLRREEYLAELKTLEGVTMERLAEMIPLLPYTIEPMLPAPGEPHTINLSLQDGLPVQYAVALPSEYNPAHRYPAIVVLRRSGMSLEETLKWWAGTSDSAGMAMTRGYIVIAPEFAEPAAEEYDYDVAAHRRVVAALTDARKRFAIDSDRVFIAGHQLGGDAAFDIALSHPDLFAGAAPFVARMDRYSRFLAGNGSHFPWYIVSGERHLPAGKNDPDAQSRSLGSVNRMALTNRADVTYCEYKARGFESYHEELTRLFDWMDTHRRRSLREIRDGWEVDVMRPLDDRFFWVGSKEQSSKLSLPINWDRPRSPMSFSARMGLENGADISVPADKPVVRAEVWLAPSFFDFEKRLKVRLNGRNVMNALVEPDPGAMLEDFRIRGDRQQLYWAKVDL